MCGSAGDYEVLPEVYLATCMTVPWTDKTIMYMRDLLEPGAMKMTEDEILAGIDALLERYPRVAAWITFKTIYIACLARMPNLIARVTELMERRNRWFSPGGEFEHFSYDHTFYDSYGLCHRRLDLPEISQIGPYNIHRYLKYKDSCDVTINLNQSLRDWVTENKCDNTLYEVLGHALACNVRMWQEMECGSMNRYVVEKKFIACLSHCITPTKVKHTLDYEYTTPMTNDSSSTIIWHTRATRCGYCPTQSKCTHAKLWEDRDCTMCLPDTPISALATSPYECVVASAVNIRRRRLRGVFYCAIVLLGKAKAMHYRPEIGSAFHAAKQDFYACVKN